MYERYVGKKIKIVWIDGGREKAIVGVLESVEEDFLTIKAVVRGNLLSISKKVITSISEYGGGGR